MSFAKQSEMRRPRRGRGLCAAVFASAALPPLLLGLGSRASSSGAFVGSTAAPQRRQALGGLLPLLLPVVATPDTATAAAPEVVTCGRFSFELPPGGAKEWVRDKQCPRGEASYQRKDGAFVVAGPVSPGFAKDYLNAVAGPGNGIVLEKYSLGEKQDDLEYTKEATIFKGASGGGPLIGGFLFNQGDPTSFHSMTRVLHGPEGDFGIRIEMYWDQYVNQKAALRKVLESFRLIEA